MPRLFVAVWPSEEVVAQLAALPRPDLAGVRWTSPDQWHVTVRFLGEADLETAITALGTVGATVTQALLGPRVARLGDTVVQVPVSGLDDLAASVGDAFASVGERPSHRRFRGHLTLARLKGTTRCPLIGTELAATFAVHEVALVHSTTHHAGARYETVAAQPLTAPT